MHQLVDLACVVNDAVLERDAAGFLFCP